MKYQIGDVVRIKEDVKSLEEFGIIGSVAREIAGKECKIHSVDEERNIYSIRYDNLEWWLNKEQIEPANKEQIEPVNNNKAFLFSYTIGKNNSVCCPEQIIVLAEGQKEANKKFYEWLVENKEEFVELTMRCEEMELLK